MRLMRRQQPEWPSRRAAGPLTKMLSASMRWKTTLSIWVGGGSGAAAQPHTFGSPPSPTPCQA
jgi:hypothetical protein